MKKYYKLFIILLIVSFVIPQIVFASWYNPFSWFKKGQANVSQSIKCEPQIVEKVVEKIATTDCKAKIVNKEIPVEKIVYRDNPQQADKIQQLFNELQDSNRQLSSCLDTAIQRVSNSSDKCNKGMEELVSTCKDVINKRDEQWKANMDDLYNQCKSVLISSMKSCSSSYVPPPIPAPQYNSSIRCTYNRGLYGEIFGISCY